MDTDASLVERAIKDDGEAVDTLWSRHHPALREFVRSRVPAAEVDDLVQETEVHAWRHLDSFNGHSSFRTWLFSIARHLIVDYRRARHNHAQMLIRLREDASRVATATAVEVCAAREWIERD